MATTDADPFEEFDRLYKPLDDDYAIVRRDMSVLIEELDQACLRASEHLSLIAQQCTNDEAKLNCDQSIRQMRQLVEKLNVANAAVEAHAVKCQATAKLFRQWRDHIQGQLAKVERLSRLSTEDRGISREFSVAFSPRDATWDYFAALPAVHPKYVITVMQRVAYIDDEVRQEKVTQQHYLYRGIRLRAFPAYLCLTPSGCGAHGSSSDTLSAFGANAVRLEQLLGQDTPYAMIRSHVRYMSSPKATLASLRYL